MKATFVRVQRSSTQLSISLSQVTVSRENRCSGTKWHQGRARADSWVQRYDSREDGHCTPHPAVWVGIRLLSERSTTQTWPWSQIWSCVYKKTSAILRSLSCAKSHKQTWPSCSGDIRALSVFLNALLLTMASMMHGLYLNGICTWISI